MSLRIQRFFTYIASLAVLAAILCVGVSAYNYPTMPSDISKLKVTVGNVTLPLSNYPDGSVFSPEKSTMTVAEQQLFGIKAGSDINLRGWECVGFARYVYTALFYKYPQDATIDNALAYTSGSSSYAYKDMIQSVLGCKSVAGGYTAATLKKLFTACQPGAVMRVGGHSMVLMAIYDNGFVIYDANFSSNNEVDVRSYTWQSFIDSMGYREIIALHMPTYYPGYSYSTGGTNPGTPTVPGIEYTVDASKAGTYVVYNCTSLNVRSGPTTSATRVGSLNSGSSVQVLGGYNGWAKITYGTSECWVSMNYLSGPHKTITVTFDPDGGTTSSTSKDCVVGSQFGTMPTATKSGMVFLGWYSGKTCYTASSVVPSVGSLTLKAAWGKTKFLDVPATSWYAPYVETAVEHGLLSDTAYFYPDENTKRADFVTVLSREYQRETGKALSGTSAWTFKDVSYGAYYDTPVAWAYQAGIVMGVEEGKFSPNGYVTREQVATFLYRYAKYVGVIQGEYGGASTIYKFADGGKVSNYAVSPMSWAVNIGLLKGDDQGCLNPTKYCKRCEMITIIARFVDYIGA